MLTPLCIPLKQPSMMFVVFNQFYLHLQGDWCGVVVLLTLRRERPWKASFAVKRIDLASTNERCGQSHVRPTEHIRTLACLILLTRNNTLFELHKLSPQPSSSVSSAGTAIEITSKCTVLLQNDRDYQQCGDSHSNSQIWGTNKRRATFAAIWTSLFPLMVNHTKKLLWWVQLTTVGTW